MSRLPQPQVVKRMMKKSSTRLVRPGVNTSEKALAVVQPSTSQSQGPTLLQKRVFKEALGKSALDPKRRVLSTGSQVTRIKPPIAVTKRGVEQVLQKVTMQKMVQRTPQAEYIAQTVTGIDVKPGGTARQTEVTSHQIDPAYATESAGVNITLSTTSSLTVTAAGKQVQKKYSRKTVKDASKLNKLNMNPAHVNRLVREEVEDVENTLKMLPPDLVSTSLERFPLKRKLQSLRVNSESIALLEQSVIRPAPTADEVDHEAPPEVMAAVLHAVEKGATPDSAPNQIFNTLFPEVPAEDRIKVSSIAPGPLLDMVVPTGVPQELTEEVLNEDMEQSLLEVQAMHELPATDICTENKITAAARPDQGEKKIPTVLEAEIPPWESANVQKLCLLVGGDPIDLLEATDPSILEASETLEQELSKGIDYFVDANTCPYETKIQMRGSRLPTWFPGYMAAFPHYPEVVRISRSPSGVLLSAWKAVQPRVFPEEEVVVG